MADSLRRRALRRDVLAIGAFAVTIASACSLVISVDDLRPAEGAADASDGDLLDAHTPDATADATADAEVAACPGTMCGGNSVDTAYDPANCGACGKAVCLGEYCSAGKAQCMVGFVSCGNGAGCIACKNVYSSANCVSCGATCDSICHGIGCGGGPCLGGRTPCPEPGGGGAGCFDTSTDPTNCGSCGTKCKSTQFCATGRCIDYTSAPGCRSCPCAACTGATPACCNALAADFVVCAASCGI